MKMLVPGFSLIVGRSFSLLRMVQEHAREVPGPVLQKIWGYSPKWQPSATFHLPSWGTAVQCSTTTYCTHGSAWLVALFWVLYTPTADSQGYGIGQHRKQWSWDRRCRGRRRKPSVWVLSLYEQQPYEFCNLYCFERIMRLVEPNLPLQATVGIANCSLQNPETPEKDNILPPVQQGALEEVNFYLE